MADRVFFCTGIPSSTASCYLCRAGGSGGEPVRCTQCQRSIGCHLKPTPMLCPACCEGRYGYDYMMQIWDRSDEVRRLRQWFVGVNRDNGYAGAMAP